MARTPRLTVPGGVHHVISRFVDRRWCLTGEDERRAYLHMLGRALTKSDWRCLAYCLMSSHLHFAMVAGEEELDSWARKVNSPFARWLNTKHERLGPVFADRPSATRVPHDREADVIAYIHNNPVRAHVVDDASKSTWSSHAAYLDEATRPRWLHVDEALERMGFESAQDFDRFVLAGVRTEIEFPDGRTAKARTHRIGAIEVGTPIVSVRATAPGSPA